jgi:hypothetical protein
LKRSLLSREAADATPIIIAWTIAPHVELIQQVGPSCGSASRRDQNPVEVEGVVEIVHLVVDVLDVAILDHFQIVGVVKEIALQRLVGDP